MKKKPEDPRIQAFQAYLVRRGMAPSSQAIYLRLAHRFKDAPDLAGWLEEHILQKRPSTVQVAKGAVAAWQSCFGAQQTELDAVRQLRAQRQSHLGRTTLSPGEVKALKKYALGLAAADGHYLPLEERQHFTGLLLLLLETGLRVSEACALTTADVRLDRQPAHLRVLGKGSKERTVPLNRTARALLGAFRLPEDPPEQPVFRRANGEAFTPDRVRQILRGTLPAALQGRFTPHVARHTVLTRLVEAGIDLPTVKQVAGHASLATTERYVHPSLDHQAAAMAKLDEPEPKEPTP